MPSKYVPQSNLIASDDPQVFLKQQEATVQSLNALRQANTPPLTLEQYQINNGLRTI